MASDGVDPVGLSKRTNKVSKALAPLTVTKRLAARSTFDHPISECQGDEPQ